MIIPVEAETVDDYFSQLYSVTSSTELDTIVPFYKRNRDIITLIFDNLDDLTPSYYIGRQNSLVFGSDIISISDILGITEKDEELIYSRISEYVSEYLAKIYQIVKQDYNKDMCYLSDLCSVYGEIFAVSPKVLLRDIYANYARLSTQYRNEHRLIPSLLEDVRVRIPVRLAINYHNLTDN